MALDGKRCRSQGEAHSQAWGKKCIELREQKNRIFLQKSITNLIGVGGVHWLLVEVVIDRTVQNLQADDYYNCSY